MGKHKPTVTVVDEFSVYLSLGEPGYVDDDTVHIVAPTSLHEITVEYAEDDGRVMGVYIDGVDWFLDDAPNDSAWDGSTGDGQWL